MNLVLGQGLKCYDRENVLINLKYSEFNEDVNRILTMKLQGITIIHSLLQAVPVGCLLKIYCI